MVRVGIVDDEAAARARLREQLSRFEEERGCSHEVVEFGSAAEFLAAHDAGFDILYLDIDMPGMSGMELARAIRQTDTGVSIVFCTNLQEFAVNGYQVAAVGFIVKPAQWYPFQLFHTRALEAVAERRRRLGGEEGRIVVKDGASSHVVELADLVYVEVRKHALLYNVSSGPGAPKSVLQVRGAMRAAAEELGGRGFSRCSASYLVNLAHVRAVDRMEVVLDGETLPIGRTYKDSFKRDFARYLAEKGRRGAWS